MTKIPNRATPARARRALLLLLTVTAVGAGLLLAPARADLTAYIARPEPAYRWEAVRTEKAGLADFPIPLPGGEVTVHELRLTSQEWQGIPWTPASRCSARPMSSFPTPP